MKNQLLSKSIFMLAIATLMLSTVSFAQRGMRPVTLMNDSTKFERGIPNLTPDQKTKIKSLKVKFIKEVTPLKNEIAEKRAHLKTLGSVDKPDINAINKTIDELSMLTSRMMKQAASHRIEVSSLLTDEQKVFFNSHQDKIKKGEKGMKQGKMNRERRGMGRANCPNCPINK
jgi:Spy/CpxP family protein refolding chaperone